MTVADAPVLINGLPLPAALVDEVRAGRWVAPESDVLERVFGEPDGGALFYSLDLMRRENAAWPGRKRAAFFGQPRSSPPPGDIDPARSVLIGDLQPDCMIALDYRTSPGRPSVVYLRAQEPFWVRVADSIEELIHRMAG
jgi:hypothetical protein